MSGILEESFLVLVVGVLVSVVSGFLWLQTGRTGLLYLMGLAALLTATLVLLERFVETDRERVADTLQQIARDVESNDVQAALSWIHLDAEAARQQAARELPLYEFHHVDIKSNLEIEVFDDQTPKEAEACFNVGVVLNDRTGTLREEVTILRYVEVRFQERDGRWLVIDFHHHPPTQGLRRSN